MGFSVLRVEPPCEGRRLLKGVLRAGGMDSKDECLPIPAMLLSCFWANDLSSFGPSPTVGMDSSPITLVRRT